MPPNYPPLTPQKKGSRLLFPFLITLLFLIVTLCFAIWAFTGREDYKNNSDQKAAAAVAAAEEALDAKKEAEFAEREKEPLKEYKTGSTLGNVVIKYPKTWSAYVTSDSRGATPLDGYLHPDYVPGVSSGTAFALHFQVTNTPYDEELNDYEQSTASGLVSVTPINAPQVSNVSGVRISGEIEEGKQGVTILFPLRDKTLKLTAESTEFVDDLDTFILPNLTFVP